MEQLDKILVSGDKKLERLFISELSKVDNEKVMLRGWVHKIIDLSHVVFVKLRDKSGIVQLVCDKDQVKDLRLENAIEVIGTKCENEKAPGKIEVIAEKIEIVGNTYYEKLPFEVNSYKNKASLETQLDHRTVALKRPEIRAIFKVQSEIENAFRSY